MGSEIFRSPQALSFSTTRPDVDPVRECADVLPRLDGSTQRRRVLVRGGIVSFFCPPPSSSTTSPSRFTIKSASSGEPGVSQHRAAGCNGDPDLFHIARVRVLSSAFYSGEYNHLLPSFRFHRSSRPALSQRLFHIDARSGLTPTVKPVLSPCLVFILLLLCHSEPLAPFACPTAIPFPPLNCLSLTAPISLISQSIDALAKNWPSVPLLRVQAFPSIV